MSLKQKINDDMKQAMKAGDKRRLDALRMVKAKMLEAEVSLRGSKGRDYELDDAEVIGVLGSYAKQRRDSIDSFRQGGREEMAAAEEAELAIIQEYMPRQMTPEEVRAIVAQAIASSGAASAKDTGAVMKLVMPQVKGKADGKLVSQIVGDLLSGK